MLFTQYLCHLLLQDTDALLRLKQLTLRFLPQLFEAFAELHALQFGNQRFQLAESAGYPHFSFAIILICGVQQVTA